MDAITTAGPPPADLPLANDVLQLLAQAQRESDRLGHEYVGAEHLVFAMTRPPASPAAAILESSGVDADLAYRSLAGVISPGAGSPGPGVERPYTSRTKRVFALAAESARELGHARVKSVHVLVGVMREGVNPAAQVLGRLGFTAAAAHEGCRQIVANGNAP